MAMRNPMRWPPLRNGRTYGRSRRCALPSTASQTPGRGLNRPIAPGVALMHPSISPQPEGPFP